MPVAVLRATLGTLGRASLTRMLCLSRELRDVAEELIAEIVAPYQLAADRCKTPLTLAENELAVDAINAPSLANVVEGFDRVLTGADTSLLAPRAWLNDEVMNFYAALLQARDDRLCTGDSKMQKSLFLNSFFIASLVGANCGSFDYASVERWTKDVDLFSLRLVIAIVNQGNMHWSLVVFDFERKTIRFYDSLGGAGTG